MIALNRFLKKKGVRILVTSGIALLAVNLVLGKLVFNVDLILSSFIFLFVLGFMGVITSKRKLSLMYLFFLGYGSMIIYNAGIGMLGLAEPLSMTSLLLSGLDLGITTVVVGYFMGVRK